jgi:hypothetical protein
MAVRFFELEKGVRPLKARGPDPLPRVHVVDGTVTTEYLRSRIRQLHEKKELAAVLLAACRRIRPLIADSAALALEVDATSLRYDELTRTSTGEARPSHYGSRLET